MLCQNKLVRRGNSFKFFVIIYLWEFSSNVIHVYILFTVTLGPTLYFKTNTQLSFTSPLLFALRSTTTISFISIYSKYFIRPLSFALEFAFIPQQRALLVVPLVQFLQRVSTWSFLAIKEKKERERKSDCLHTKRCNAGSCDLKVLETAYAFMTIARISSFSLWLLTPFPLENREGPGYVLLSSRSLLHPSSLLYRCDNRGLNRRRFWTTTMMMMMMMMTRFTTTTLETVLPHHVLRRPLLEHLLQHTPLCDREKLSKICTI